MTSLCTSLEYTVAEPEAPLVGVVVLATDEVLEDELRVRLTPTTRVLHTRIPNDTTVNSDTLGAMQAALPTALELLPDTSPMSVVAYGCTSGTTVIGEAEVEALIKARFPSAAVTNPLTALKAQLQHLKVERLALLTPYEPHVSHALYDHLSECGYEIVSFGSFNEPLDSNVCRITEASLKDAIKTLHDQAPCDALFASCTNLRTVSWLDDYATQIGTPLLSSNSAMSWHINELISRS